MSRDLVIASNFDAFGVPATVVRPFPDDTPIETTGIWCTPQSESGGFLGGVPGDFDIQRRDRQRVIALKVDDVATAPSGTRIEMAEHGGGASQVWRVDGLEYADAHHRRVIVVPETEP